MSSWTIGGKKSIPIRSESPAGQFYSRIARCSPSRSSPSGRGSEARETFSFRFASSHLWEYFPNLLSHIQFNHWTRALEAELRTLQGDLAHTLTKGSEVYRILDTTLIPAVVRIRACRNGLFAGQAAFSRCTSKTEWVYVFKVALSLSPKGVITAFGLAEARSDERPIGEFLVSSDGHHLSSGQGVLLPKVGKHWLERYGALVADTPQKSVYRAWPKEACKWASGKRPLMEGVIDQLKDIFALEHHRARTLGGLLTRLAAKVVAYTCGQCLNARLGRPLRHIADLLV